MNRLSFLKTIGVGIAAAVITPKLLTDTLIDSGKKDKEGEMSDGRIPSNS
jgi:hypothetical protein